MTDEQHEAVVKWAQGQRLSISESLRRVVLSDVSDICDTAEYLDARKRFYYEMERIANNIKQIIRKTHQNIWGIYLTFEEYFCGHFDSYRKYIQDDFVFPEDGETAGKHRVSLLVTDNEYKRVCRKACTMALSDYVKARIRSCQSRRWSIDTKKANNINVWVNGIGQVINHAAYKVNAGITSDVSREMSFLRTRMTQKYVDLLKAELKFVKDFKAQQEKLKEKRLEEQRRQDAMKKREAILRQTERAQREAQLEAQRILEENLRREEQERKRKEEERKLEEQKKAQPLFEKLETRGVIWLIDNKRCFVTDVDRENLTANVIYCHPDDFMIGVNPPEGQINIKEIQTCVKANGLSLLTKYHRYAQGDKIRLHQSNPNFNFEFVLHIYSLMTFQGNLIVGYSYEYLGGLYVFKDMGYNFIQCDENWTPIQNSEKAVFTSLF